MDRSIAKLGSGALRRNKQDVVADKSHLGTGHHHFQYVGLLRDLSLRSLPSSPLRYYSIKIPKFDSIFCTATNDQIFQDCISLYNWLLRSIVLAIFALLRSGWGHIAFENIINLIIGVRSFDLLVFFWMKILWKETFCDLPDSYPMHSDSFLDFIIIQSIVKFAAHIVDYTLHIKTWAAHSRWRKHIKSLGE